MIIRRGYSIRRLLGSGIVWTAAAIICIECCCWKYFPSRYFSHEVDRLLYTLQTSSFDADTVVLGDSVGRQLSQYLADSGEKDFIPLATNGALQMAGQYYIFLRYLERNPPPQTVILLKHRPLHGDLDRPATENYVQRCFTRWHEIAGMTLRTGQPGFGLRMLSYRLLATAKYRLHLQKLVPGLETPEVWAEAPLDAEQPETLAQKTAAQIIMNWFFPQKYFSISEYYLIRLLDLCAGKNIRVCYLPCPMPEKQWNRYQYGPAHTLLVSRMKELSQQYPNLVYTTEVKAYPGGWFVDGVHVEKANLPQVAGDYALMMDELMKP
ncbi:MAG: hypothetical protein AB7T27_04405 [Kiritimatiellia bacterium]